MKTRVQGCHGRTVAGLCVAALLLMGGSSALQGQNLPENPSHGGNITINVNGNLMTINSALLRDIINWDRFSIGSGYHVDFNLTHPNAADGAVLNRVLLNDPSVIAGTLTSNGTVYLVNPAGIIFTPSAVVDVGGIYAAAGHMSDADFLAGIDRFTIDAGEGLQGHVINSGRIGVDQRAYQINLIGRVVYNTHEGRITAAPGGVIALVASTGEVILSELGGHTMVRINGHELDFNASYVGDFNGPAPSLEGAMGVRNDGVVEADSGGRIIFGAGDMYSLAIYNSGEIVARDGEVNLTAMNGLVYHGPDIKGGGSPGPATLSGDHVTIAGDVVQLGSDVSGKQTLTIFDPTIVREHITLRSPDARLLHTVDGLKVGLQSLTIDGNVLFDGAVGGSKALQSLHVLGTSRIDGGLIRTTGDQTYDGAVTLGHHALLDGSLMTFHGRLDALASGQQGLAIQGQAVFDEQVGGLAPLAYLSVSDESWVNGGLVHTSGLQHYGGDLTLGHDTTLIGSHMIFDSRVRALISGQQGLTVNGNATFNDAVGASILSFLTVNGDTVINGPSITTTGNQLYNGTVMLGGNSVLTGRRIEFASTLDGTHALVINAAEFLRFGGNVGLSSSLASLETNVGGVIRVDGQYIGTIGDIRFNPLGHSGVPLIATIGASGDLTVHSAVGSISLGPNQKLTAIGDLRLEAMNGSLTFGDLSALGSIQVFSPDIFVRTRVPGQLLDFNGALIQDSGVDIVAGGEIFFSSAPTLLGSGVAQFASSTGQFSDTLRGRIVRFGDPLFATMFTFDGDILDLAATGATPDDLAEALALSSEIEDRVEDRVLLDPARREALERMNLFVRDLRAEELRDTVIGRELYDDSSGAIAHAPQDRQIALNRLRRESAIMVADRYNRLFLEQSVNVETGETIVTERSEEIQRALEDAWKSYLVLAEGDPSTEGFLEYLRITTQHMDARDYVASLRRLFQDIRTMGINRAEFRAAVDAVLGPITPGQMSQADLESMIVGGAAGQQRTNA